MPAKMLPKEESVVLLPGSIVSSSVVSESHSNIRNTPSCQTRVVIIGDEQWRGVIDGFVSISYETSRNSIETKNRWISACYDDGASKTYVCPSVRLSLFQSQYDHHHLFFLQM